MVGASFTVAAVAQVLRSKKGITAVGNAQIDTAQSKFGGASALFDGTGDYLQLNDASLELGTNNWTIEFWLRLNNVSGFKNLLDYRTGGAGVFPTIYIQDSTIRYFTNGSDRITGGTLSTGIWYHIAVSKSGSDHKMFIDGTQGGSTYTAANTYIGTTPTIGAFYTGASSHNGHLDEIRISNSARYTAGFTPATTPFVNDANTLLLIHADGTDASTFFEDDNGVRAPKGITAVGNAQVSTAQSQFGGASLLLDGTGDYLTVNNSAGILSFNTTQDFTFEAWCRFANTNTYFTIFSGPGQTGSFQLARVDDNTVRVGRTNVAWDAFSTGSATTANTWQHIAASRSNGTLRIFVNGVSVHSSANTQSYPLTTTMGIGGDTVYGSSSNGYIDEVRVSNIARYTANFTPSTTPFVNDPTTLFLMHADGTNGSTVFRDDNGVRSQKGVQAIGNAQVDTAQSKFGGSSYLGDGTGDYLIANNVLTFLGDFTIECWFRTSSVSSDQYIITADGVGTALPGVAAYLNGNALKIYSNQNGSWTHLGNVTVATISINTWYHISITRSGSTWYASVNGTITNLGTYGATISASGDVIVGALTWTSVVSYVGHIDEVRVSNSARYTANFTPSTTSFQNDDNTLLLLHMDGTDASTVFFDDNGRTPTP
jgi:hypothetical protein